MGRMWIQVAVRGFSVKENFILKVLCQDRSQQDCRPQCTVLRRRPLPREMWQQHVTEHCANFDNIIVIANDNDSRYHLHQQQHFYNDYKDHARDDDLRESNFNEQHSIESRCNFFQISCETWKWNLATR